MKNLYIPYLYAFKNTLVYKRVYKKGDKIYFKVRIFYKLDFFTYKTINHNFDSELFNNNQVDRSIEQIITELDKQFK